MPVELRQRVADIIEANSKRLTAVSQTIHDNPELGLKEYQAADLLAAEAESLGFTVQRGAAGLETAFVAEFKGDKPGPIVGFLAEYDAVPGLGHACGHNLIAASALGAALALKELVSETGGVVRLYGTPDEEAVDRRSKGGKVIMAEAGLFTGLNAILMMHPVGGPSAAWSYSFPLIDFIVEYLGRPAHYTVPHKGINALEALLTFIHNLNALKRGWPAETMLAYTITDGGGPSPIVVPKRAEAHFTMKAFYSALLDELYEKVAGCARNVASAFGAKLSLRIHSRYKNTIPNLNLTLSLHRNMTDLGGEMADPLSSQQSLERRCYPGNSTDFGDVSWVSPGIHGYCSIGGPDLVSHTEEFAAAAGSPTGNRAMLMAAKAMAMTGAEILGHPEFAGRVRAEFEGYRAGGFLTVPGIPPHYPEFPQDFIQRLRPGRPQAETT